MAPFAGVSLLTWLAGSNAMRASVDVNLQSTEGFFEHGAAAAKKIHSHINTMTIGEYHHVCVSGNVAGAFVDAFLLQGTGSEREQEILPGNADSTTECTAEKAIVGNVQYTIVPQIEDRCVARWKRHTSSCDVLIHASTGKECDQLYKFRLLHENCDSELIIVYDENEFSTCYLRKMAEFAQKNRGAWCGEEEDTHEWVPFSAQGNEQALQKNAEGSAKVADAMTKALAKNADIIKRMIESAEGLDKNAAINTKMQQAKKQESKVIDVANEIADITAKHSDKNGFLDITGALMQLSGTQNRKRTEAPGPEVGIMIDLGSGTMRAGYAGDEKPTASFANMVGIPKYDEVIVGVDNKEQYIGDEADAMRGVLKLTYPVKHGIIEDWDMLDHVWTHLFNNELRTEANGKKLMISEPPLNPLHTRTALAEWLFDKKGAAAVYVNNAAVLSLYAAGVQTGLAVTSGDGVTHMVPVYEGYGLTHFIERIDMGGAHITDYLKKLLSKRGEFRGQDAETSAAHEIRKDIKEKHCYVAFEESEKDNKFFLDYVEAGKKADTNEETVKYELPDKKVITLGRERFECAEPLFDPMLIGIETKGIHELIVKSIEASDLSVRDALYNNIAISGGNTMFPGFVGRLKKEIEKLRPANEPVNIFARADRAIHTWVGGSILASLTTFNDPAWPMWFMNYRTPEMTAADNTLDKVYSEDGVQGFSEKCPWQR